MKDETSHPTVDGTAALRAPVPMESESSSLFKGPAQSDESDMIQTLRGLACLLLVAFHVVGDTSLSGMRVEEESEYREFANLFIHLRMPLFTFLSGFVYAYRPVAKGKEMVFVRKKFLRLYIPMSVAATLFFFLQYVTPNTNSTEWLGTIWMIFIYPYSHYWFIQAIIIVFIAVCTLEAFGALGTFSRFTVVVAAAFLCNLFVSVTPNVFSINQAIYLLPFFLTGLGANRFRARFLSDRMRLVSVSVFAVTMSIHSAAALAIFGNVTGRDSLFSAILSVTSLLTLLYAAPHSRWLAWIGKFSFTIYLYHVFFTAGSRIALHQIGVTADQVVFISGVAAGVLGPIAAEIILRYRPPVSRVVLGN